MDSLGEALELAARVGAAAQHLQGRGGGERARPTVAPEVKGGSVRLKLGELAVKAAIADFRGESEEGAALAPDRYELLIHAGAVHVELDTVVQPVPTIRTETSEVCQIGATASALEILLDGVESRARGLS